MAVPKGTMVEDNDHRLGGWKGTKPLIMILQLQSLTTDTLVIPSRYSVFSC